MGRCNCRILAALLLHLVLIASAYGGTVRVRLYSAIKPATVVFSSRSADFVIEVPGMESVRVSANTPVVVWSWGGSVAVKWGADRGVVADSVRILPAGGEAQPFAVSVPGAEGERRYTGSLVCRNTNGMFLVINETETEEYLPGVVLTEGGPGRHPEFYKAQAVLARTFARLNLPKHATDGYHLCDDVHCQAYHGIVSDSAVVSAVKATAGQVMVSADSVLLLPAFHSNCGGQTSTAADAWVTDMKHLQSVTDPFCVNSRNAAWKASVPTLTWIDVLRKYGYEGELSRASSVFVQDSRKPFFEPSEAIRIPVRTLRNEFGLRSAFFSLRVEGDSVVIEGRGYGHGVGMCQEGAMEMARQGFGATKILEYYFSGILLVDVGHAKTPPVVK